MILGYYTVDDSGVKRTKSRKRQHPLFRYNDTVRFPPLVATALSSPGRMAVVFDGELLLFKDCVLLPYKAIHWCWQQTGLRTSPGMGVAEIMHWLSADWHSYTHIFVSQGFKHTLRTERLQTVCDTHVAGTGAYPELFVASTADVIQAYNLAVTSTSANKPVKAAAFFHS